MRSDPTAVAAAVDEPTPRGIASAIARLITAGEFAPGDRMPTVRGLAATLGVSPATVSAAWQTLAGAGLIVSRGRSGTTVRDIPHHWLPARYRDLRSTEDVAIDLSRGTPDPALLPALGSAIRAVADDVDAISQEPTSYQRPPDIAELHDLLKASWPAPVETLTVVDGALDAVDRALGTLVQYGDRAVVPAATFPPFLDLLEQYGLEPLPVEQDEHGVVPDSFAAALARAPRIVLLQPRADNPTGASMPGERVEALGTALTRVRQARRTVVIEDDHSGAISSAPAVSLGTIVPDRVLHVRSFSKTHGPDLRIGAIGGPRALIEPIVARRLLGPAWTSRMAQTILYRLLTDAATIAAVDHAREVYAHRQQAFAAAMANAGEPIPVADGLNAWIPVADERETQLRLAADGIRVAPGRPFQLGGAPRIRVTVGVLDGDPQPVADAIAAAARAVGGGPAGGPAGGAAP